MNSFRNTPTSAYYPKNIDELNTPQYIHYLMLLSKVENGELTHSGFKEEWKNYLLKPYGDSFDAQKSIPGFQGFFRHTNQEEEQVDTFSVKNKLTQYTWKNRIFKGPQDMGYDLSFGTFLSACFVFKDYSLSPNPEALKYLFAILYSDGSPLTERVAHLSDMPQYVALSAFYFFKSVVQNIATSPIYYEGEELPLYEIFEDTSGNCGGYIPSRELLLFDMANEGHEHPQNIEELKSRNFYEVLSEIWYSSKVQTA